MIIEVFSSGPLETNTILLGCPITKKGAIIDSPYESTDLLLQALKKYGLQLEMILMTHSHWDHIADVAQLKKKIPAPVYVHREDAGNLRNPGSDGLPLILPIEGIEPEGFLEEGQVLNVGEIKIRVLHTPGHTPGGVCFFIEKEKVLISGDTLFRGTIGSLSLPTARPTQMKETLHKLALLPPDIRVIPGHGNETSIGGEKETFRKFLSRS
jgi:hydroxyacylglutathione hydrolase